MRKVICSLEKGKPIDVKMVGEYLTKRDLIQVIKAIKIAHRRQIRAYRQKKMSLASRRRVEADNKAENENLGVKSNDTDSITAKA